MTNKPMLSVERELLVTLCNLHAVGFEDIAPEIKELRAILDKPVLKSWPCWSCKTHITLAERAEADGECPHCEAELDLDDWPIEAAAQQQGEPVYQVEYLLSGGGGWHDVTKARYDASQNPCWRTRIVYAEKPAPVAVVMPERKTKADYSGYIEQFQSEAAGLYNSALDDVARLNGG